ncbi:MAG: L-seryl-tRNA(Sec) selenium transferase [Deltaproteobacteria bacterium]|nr:L-seryl-tRNA(Sec) selenium transferase [Deltaproteobacteria bacterium]
MPKSNETKNAYRTIPKVDTILKEDILHNINFSEKLVKKGVSQAIERIRESIKAGRISVSPDAAHIANDVVGEITGIMQSGLTSVINAAGVVVYTNLGRAPLARQAVETMITAARGYSNLEYDLELGGRGSRQDHIRPITRLAFGAEDALVVNNNAAAVLLILSTLARGREVIVSRGELVEIGGSFRMPEVMEMSGAILREVGSTNRTRLKDYCDAINENTAMIMKVHKSNFAMVGFTQEVEIKELSRLAHDTGLPFYIDMGSGVPIDLSVAGIKGEWTIKECLEHAGVISFSGDKVIGGPQAGIILGNTEYVEPMAKNPLHRALRVDKFTIAALSETLRLLAKEQFSEIPVLRMITESKDSVKQRAEDLKRRLSDIESELIETSAVIGGGAAPTQNFPSYGLVVKSSEANRIHHILRKSQPAVVARIVEDRLIFDLKAVGDDEIGVLAEKIKEACAR